MHALHLKYYGRSEQLLSNESFLMIVYFKLFYNKNLKKKKLFLSLTNLLQIWSNYCIFCEFNKWKLMYTSIDFAVPIQTLCRSWCGYTRHYAVLPTTQRRKKTLTFASWTSTVGDPSFGHNEFDCSKSMKFGMWIFHRESLLASLKRFILYEFSSSFAKGDKPTKRLLNY